MPYPSYMDQLGAWPSSPNPINGQPDPAYNGPYTPEDYADALGTQKPASITGTSDPNANMSSQNIMDMIRKKQQDYAYGQTQSPMAGAIDTTGVATRSPDITSQIDATSDAAGMMQSPTNAVQSPTMVPSNQDTLIGGSTRLTRGLSPDVYNNILQQTAGDPRFNSAPVTGRNETTGQDFTMTPGRRIPLAVAASIQAKQALAQQLEQGNQQADLANQRRMALAAVPGQSAVNLQNARNTGAQAIQGMQNTNEQTLQAQRLSQQQQQWEDQRPLREAQVRQLASQSGMNDAETKAKLAAIDNMDTPQSRTARAAMQYATALDPNDPSKGDIFMQALNSLGGQPGAAGGGTAGIGQAVGQANQYGADRNTAQYMATDPEYAATVKALKGAKPGIGTAIMSGIAKAGQQDFGTTFGAGGVKNANEQKWVQAVQQTQDHFNTIAARKHLNAKALMDGAMKQVQ